LLSSPASWRVCVDPLASCSPLTKSLTSAGLDPGTKDIPLDISPTFVAPLHSSCFSKALISSHLARSLSAFSLASADCARHDCTCDSYSDFHDSSVEAEDDGVGSTASGGGGGGVDFAACGEDSGWDLGTVGAGVNAVESADFSKWESQKFLC